jgi:hypothetical protein
MKQKRDWTTAKKALASIGLAVAALAYFGYSWWKSLNVMPVLTIPTPKMPSPNARDVYIKACDSIVDGKKADIALSTRHSGQGDDRPYSLAEKAALIRENAMALQMLREGFACEYREPPVRSAAAPFTHYAKFREMARLKMLEAQVRGAQGDWNGAMNSHLDTIYFGQEVPRGGVLIGQLVGIAIQAIGRKSAGEPIRHLDAKRARAATKRMETILAHRVPFADVMQEEKWYGQSSLIETAAAADAERPDQPDTPPGLRAGAAEGRAVRVRERLAAAGAGSARLPRGTRALPGEAGSARPVLSLETARRSDGAAGLLRLSARYARRLYALEQERSGAKIRGHGLERPVWSCKVRLRGLLSLQSQASQLQTGDLSPCYGQAKQ